MGTEATTQPETSDNQGGQGVLDEGSPPGTTADETAKGNWRDGLSDDLKGHTSLATFADIEALAKSFIETKAYQGNSIRIPGEDAGTKQQQEFVSKLLAKVPGVMLKPDLENDEQSTNFFRTLGMPEKSEEYETGKTEYPEGVTENVERTNFFKGLAHEVGLTKGQFKKFMAKVTEVDINEASQAADSQKQSLVELDKEWGLATRERMDVALSTAERTQAPPEMIEAFKAGTLPPATIRWLHSLSVSLGNEGNNLGNSPGSTVGKMTPSEARDKIAEIYGNKDHPFHKGEKHAINRMLELVGNANPEANKDVNSLRSGVSFGI